MRHPFKYGSAQVPPTGCVNLQAFATRQPHELVIGRGCDLSPKYLWGILLPKNLWWGFVTKVPVGICHQNTRGGQGILNCCSGKLFLGWICGDAAWGNAAQQHLHFTLPSGTDNSATEADVNKMFATSWPMQVLLQPSRLGRTRNVAQCLEPTIDAASRRCTVEVRAPHGHRGTHTTAA